MKVLDFGISKYREGAPGVAHHELTTTDKVIGSPSYMSPEQLRAARDVDARADVWAFGAVLYKLTVGKNPFSGATSADLCVQILVEPPDKPGDDVELPDGFLPILERCLEKEVENRYDDLGGVAEALRPFCSPEAQVSIQRVVRTLASGLSRPVSSHRISDPDQPTVDQPRSRSSSRTDPTPSIGTVGPAVQSGRPSLLKPKWRRSLPVILTSISSLGFIALAVWTFTRSPLTSPVTTAGSQAPATAVTAEVSAVSDRSPPGAASVETPLRAESGTPATTPDAGKPVATPATATAPLKPVLPKRPGTRPSATAGGSEFSGFGERK